MERDAQAPPVWGCPESQRREGDQQRHARHGMRTYYSEIDHDDHAGEWQAVPHDRERPRVTGVTGEDEAADRTARKKGPAGKESTLAAMGTTLAHPAPERRPDQFRRGGVAFHKETRGGDTLRNDSAGTNDHSTGSLYKQAVPAAALERHRDCRASTSLAEHW